VHVALVRLPKPPVRALPAITALAEHYATSRSTVAKALKRMEADGLVEIVPQWGTSGPKPGRAGTRCRSAGGV